jgi:hypothetical protein
MDAAVLIYKVIFNNQAVFAAVYFKTSSFTFVIISGICFSISGVSLSL